MKIKRALYLGYYLKQLDRESFSRFLDYARVQTGRSRVSLVADLLSSVLTYNISLLEYFQFHFYELSGEKRLSWAGTGHMYEYQLRMNPRRSRKILEDKTRFHQYYREFFVHQVADLRELDTNSETANLLLANPTGKLVFKEAKGKCGNRVQIRNCSDFDRETLLKYMKSHDYDLVEEYIEQHSDLKRLAPSAVNTVRIFTQLNERGGVDILGCRLRISVNGQVDNMAAGNLAAPIDEYTGRVSGPAVYSDITKAEEVYHPVTQVKIPGFQIPFWRQVMVMGKKAALLHPQNRSIGWDIVVTPNGPGLIEGNHDWCKLLWQLPVKKGLKSVLNGY